MSAPPVPPPLVLIVSPVYSTFSPSSVFFPLHINTCLSYIVVSSFSVFHFVSITSSPTSFRFMLFQPLRVPRSHFSFSSPFLPYRCFFSSYQQPPFTHHFLSRLFNVFVMSPVPLSPISSFLKSLPHFFFIGPFFFVFSSLHRYFPVPFNTSSPVSTNPFFFPSFFFPYFPFQYVFS